MEDFETWNPNDFKDLDTRARRALRELLQFRGIYIGKLHGPTNNKLADLTKATQLPEWNHDDLRVTTVSEKTAAYRLQQELLAPESQRLLSPIPPPETEIRQQSTHAADNDGKDWKLLCHITWTTSGRRAWKQPQERI